MTFSMVAAAALTNGLLIGFVPTFVDGVKPMLASRLGRPEPHLEWFDRLFFLAWVPLMPLAGFLLDFGANREVLLFAGLVPLIMGIAWLALARDARSMLLASLVLGAAYSFLTTATIRMMPIAFFPDLIERYHLNLSGLNLGFAAIGVGALVGPWVTMGINRWGSFRQSLLVLSVSLLIPAGMTALCDSRQFPSAASTAASWDEIAGGPRLAMLAVIILLYFAAENCLEYWPEAYLKEIGYEGRGLQIGLTVFWLTFIGSRVVAGWWLYEHETHGMVLTLILLTVSAMVMGNMVGGFEFGSGSIGFWLLGACYGPLLPGFLGIALDLFAPQALPTWVLGGFLALSGVDTLIVRPLMNAFTVNRPARSVMRVPTLLALAAAGILLVLSLL